MESYSFFNKRQGSVQNVANAGENTYSNTRSRGRGRGWRGRRGRGRGKLGAQTQRRGNLSTSREELRNGWQSEENMSASDSESVYSVESRVSGYRTQRGRRWNSRVSLTYEESDDDFRSRRYVPGQRNRCLSTSSYADSENDFTEEDVFRNLVESVGGITSVSQYMADCVPSHMQNEFKQWLKRRSEKISVYIRRHNPIYIGPLLKKASLCVEHIGKNGCSRPNCSHFHICKFYLNGICKRGVRCWKGHNLKGNEQNEQLIENLGFEGFSDKGILTAILCRYPQVCRTETCSRGEDCPYLHICYNFIVNRCQDDDCERGHSFETPHNKWVLKVYRMERWPNEKLPLLKTLINMPRKQKDIRYSEENTQQGYSTDDMTDEETKPQIKPIIQPKSTVFKAERPLTTFSSVNEEEAHQKEICLNQLTGVCPERHCQNHHTELPYLWQIHMFGKWVSFDNNQMLEQWYCNLEDSARGKVYFADNEWDINLHFEKGHGSCTNGTSLGALRIRRLSTASFGKENEPPSGGSFHTQWRWYFRNDWHQWELFEKDELQHTLEKKYTTGQKSYLFTRESHKFKYRISFSDWTQTNIDTGKSRKLIRRPVFTSVTEVRLRQFPRTLHISSLDPHPPEWNALDLAHEFELVELEETNKEFDSVKTEFFATLREKNIKICNIYRIQNLALWNEYKMKRLNLEKIHARKAGSLEERRLFHGTDSYDTCYGICTNNFDFRLSGKNATVYGKGSYFAVSAKYSHNYTKGPVHLMFRAKVLIGSYTAGKHDMTCPPNIPGEGHRRYDTCVDNIANPSIFVVFDRNQCYPEYLIAYRQTAETTGILKSTPARRVNPPVSGAMGVQPARIAHSLSTPHQNQSHTATVGTQNHTSQSAANLFLSPGIQLHTATVGTRNHTRQSTVDPVQSFVVHSAGAGIGASTSTNYPTPAAKSSPPLASSTGRSPSVGSSSGLVSNSATTAHPQNTTPGSPSVRSHSIASVDSQTNSGNRLFNNRGNNNTTITSIKKKKDTCSIQ